MRVIEWQPIVGCSYVSPGCQNCFTARIHGYEALTLPTKRGAVWTGSVRLQEAVLDLPARTGGHAAFLVCSHGDLFHEAAEPAWVDAVFDVIDRCPNHFFQILTKRAVRQRDYIIGRYGRSTPRNVWLGVSAEDQQRAEERVPVLALTPAFVRYVTFYPLLGRICPDWISGFGLIHSVQVGEEAERPADPSWISGIISACAGMGIPCSVGAPLIGAD